MYFGASAMAKPSFFSSDLVQVLLCPRLHELQFAVKALLAGGLALYLAFSLEAGAAAMGIDDGVRGQPAL